jgi:hypothetical protein
MIPISLVREWMRLDADHVATEEQDVTEPPRALRMQAAVLRMRTTHGKVELTLFSQAV